MTTEHPPSADKAQWKAKEVVTLSGIILSNYDFQSQERTFRLYLPLQLGELQTPAACFPLPPTTGPTRRGRLWRGGRRSREWRQRPHIDPARWELEATPQLSPLLSTGATNLWRTQVESSRGSREFL